MKTIANETEEDGGGERGTCVTLGERIKANER